MKRVAALLLVFALSVLLYGCEVDIEEFLGSLEFGTHQDATTGIPSEPSTDFPAGGTTQPAASIPQATHPTASAPQVTEPNSTEPKIQLEFQLSEDQSYYIVTGIGSWWDEQLVVPNQYNGLPVYEIGDAAFSDQRISEVVIMDGIKKIGKNAFSFCSSLQKVTMPDSVTSIGDHAFEQCNLLQSIQLPPNLNRIEDHTFMFCDQLTSINIPEGVTFIGDHAFEFCFALQEITIPASVHTIDDNAFGGCFNIKTITFCGSVPSFGSNVFECWETKVYYPENDPTWTVDVMLSIGKGFDWGVTLPFISEGLEFTLSDDGTYYILSGIGNCYDTDIVVPSKYNGLPVREIGERAFWLFSRSFNSITIPESVTVIGYSAFSGNGNLTNIYLSEGLKIIEDNAFFGCNGLTEVVLPESLESIGASVFYGCNKLAKLNLPDNLTHIGEFALCDTPIDKIVIPKCMTKIGKNAFFGVANLSEIVFHDGVTTIGESAFFGCHGLTSLVIPDSVTVIEKDAFYSCRNLSSVTLSQNIKKIDDGVFAFTALEEIDIPNSVERIGRFAFGFTKIKEITLPEAVKHIGYEAFTFCSDLKTVRFLGSVPIIDNDAFDSVSAEIQYPAGNASWNISALRQFGGNLSWCGYASDPVGWLSLSLSADGSYYIITGIDNKDISDLIIPFRYDGVPIRAIADGAFANCTQLVRVQLPGGLAQIGADAFAGCTNLQEMVFTGSVPAIGANAFAAVSADVIYPAEDPSWVGKGSGSFGGHLRWKASEWELEFSVDPHNEAAHVVNLGNYLGSYLVIPDSYEGYPITECESGAFQECTQLVTVVMGKNVRILAQNVFAYCENLNEISLPNSLKKIEDKAFYRCESLTELHLPNGVKEIYSEAFAYCTALKTITMPKQLETIGVYAFDHCVSLQEMILSDRVKVISGYAFSYCTSLHSVRLSQSLTEIEAYVFSHCENLTSIEIPDSVGAIREHAFEYCGIRQITLSNTLAEIDVYAFSHCSNLQEIVFPATLRYIYNCAFEQCTSLKWITFLGDKPYMPDGLSSPFENVVATVYYPANNDTWVGMHSYLGDLTWIAKEFP